MRTLQLCLIFVLGLALAVDLVAAGGDKHVSETTVAPAGDADAPCDTTTVAPAGETDAPCDTTTTVEETTTVAPAGETDAPCATTVAPAGETDPEVGVTVEPAADAYPQLGFETRPTYMNNKEVVLTFDDGPGWNPETTIAVLDALKASNKKATFFFNSQQDLATNWGNAVTQNVVRRVISEGHRLASHTRSHPHLQTLSDSALATEVNGVEGDIRAGVPGTTIPRISMLRAPYGEPFQWKFWGEIDDATYTRVASVVAKKFVHIGWNLDTNDWKCGTDSPGSCMSDATIQLLKDGGYGVMLMHSTNAATAKGLPALLAYLDAQRYTVVDLETVVARVYGTTSANVVDKVVGTTARATTRAAATTARTAATTARTAATTAKPVSTTSAQGICTGNLCQTGTVPKGARKYHPSPAGYYCTTGSASVTHRALLSSPTAGADLDLYFTKWDASRQVWVVVGSSTKAGSSEQVSVQQGPGCYGWQVYSFASDAAYSIDMLIPERGGAAVTTKAAATAVRTTTRAAVTTMRTTTRAAATTARTTTRAPATTTRASSGTCQVGSPECNCDAAIAGTGAQVRDGDGCLINALCEGNSQVYSHNNNTYCCAIGSSDFNVTTNEDDLTFCECGYTGAPVPGDTYGRRSNARKLRAMRLMDLQEIANAAAAAANAAGSYPVPPSQ